MLRGGEGPSRGGVGEPSLSAGWPPHHESHSIVGRGAAAPALALVAACAMVRLGDLGAPSVGLPIGVHRAAIRVWRSTPRLSSPAARP